jgi:hypothetical protein
MKKLLTLILPFFCVCLAFGCAGMPGVSFKAVGTSGPGLTVAFDLFPVSGGTNATPATPRAP